MLRVGMRVAGLLGLFLACLLPHLLSKWILGRSLWPHRFLAGAASVAGLRVTLAGEPVRPHSLLICNHLSWLDILVVGGSTDCRFVAKDQLGHGFLHWLADQNRTLYVKRSHVRGARDQALAIAKALEGDHPIALFPEGTTGPGSHLLPFRSTLLEAASFAASDVEVRPLAIDYGAATMDIVWFDEGGMDNVLRVLGRRGDLPVTVRLLPPLPRSDRKALAQAAREAIEQALAASSSAHTGL